ncbi:hypothetical protein SBRCBS47491_003806 [Sporothrix bragantina]|uniref:Zn(2)-C6 fungal-type domain-containing protein n=1 Tax=Sporothrix bragantina TaxID=671064 RepID=A0ABP0BIJ2_9PEZI
MVGVPGRSKACATCRRRKKGCDFLRPSCSQCLRAGLECGGYERGRIFVHTTQHRPSTLVSVRENSFAPGTTVDVGETPTPTTTTTIDSNNPSIRSRTASTVSSSISGSISGSVSSNLSNGIPHNVPNGIPNGMPNGITSGTTNGHGMDEHALDVVVTNGHISNGYAANGHLPIDRPSNGHHPNGYPTNEFLPNGVRSNGPINGHPIDFSDGFADGYTNSLIKSLAEAHIDGPVDDQFNDRVDVHITGYTDGPIPTFAEMGDFAPRSTTDDDIIRSPPGSPGRQAPALRHSRSAPTVSTQIHDLHVVPMYFGRMSEGSPGADRSLIGSAREELLLATFWQAYLPNSSIFPSQAIGYASGGWTNVVQQLYRKDPVLHYTLMANCFSAAARHGESRSMAEQSLRAHGRALYELRLALDNPKKARSDGVFSALRLMIVFSMFFSDRYEEDRRARARGWKEHNAGVLALLRARGPEAHMAGHGHQMFVDCRLALIVAAIRFRKRTILHSYEWMTIPWQNIPKTPKDTLIDIMSGIPGLLESVDYLEEEMSVKKDEFTADDCASFRRRIVDTLWTFDQQLLEWYDQNMPKNRLHILEKSSNDDDDVDDLVNDDYCAMSTEDLSVVYLMTVYCTACLLVYSTMSTFGIRNLPERANVSIYINRIASYLRVFFHPSTGQYGLEMTSFPLGLCLQLLSSNFHTGGDPVKQRAKFTKLLETERGKEILDFLRSMLNTNETTKEDGKKPKKKRPTL